LCKLKRQDEGVASCPKEGGESVEVEAEVTRCFYMEGVARFTSFIPFGVSIISYSVP